MIEGLPREDAEILHTAAVVGLPELACELERQELVEPEDSLEAARALRPFLVKHGARVMEDFPRYVAGAEKELERRRRLRGEES